MKDKDLQALKEKIEEMYADRQKACPSCGHCPTCGREGHQALPWYPQPIWIAPYQPWWQQPWYSSGTVTYSDNISHQNGSTVFLGGTTITS